MPDKNECPIVAKCKWRSPYKWYGKECYCCGYGLIHGKPSGRDGDFCPHFEQGNPQKMNLALYWAGREHDE
jgi:hypothetical protein